MAKTTIASKEERAGNRKSVDALQRERAQHAEPPKDPRLLLQIVDDLTTLRRENDDLRKQLADVKGSILNLTKPEKPRVRQGDVPYIARTKALVLLGRAESYLREYIMLGSGTSVGVITEALLAEGQAKKLVQEALDYLNDHKNDELKRWIAVEQSALDGGSPAKAATNAEYALAVTETPDVWVEKK